MCVRGGGGGGGGSGGSEGTDELGHVTGLDETAQRLKECCAEWSQCVRAAQLTAMRAMMIPQRAELQSMMCGQGCS